MNDLELLCLLRIKHWPGVPGICRGGEPAWQAYIENAYPVDKERVGKILLEEDDPFASRALRAARAITAVGEIQASAWSNFPRTVDPSEYQHRDVLDIKNQIRTTSDLPDRVTGGDGRVAQPFVERGEFADVILESFDRPPQANLRDFPVVDPFDAQTRIVRDVYAESLRVGLPLPAQHEVETLFVDRTRGLEQACQRAQAEFYSDGANPRFAVVFDANLMPMDLRALAYHEIKHLSDFYTGEFRQLSRCEFEIRAVTFSAEMMRRGSF